MHAFCRKAAWAEKRFNVKLEEASRISGLFR